MTNSPRPNSSTSQTKPLVLGFARNNAEMACLLGNGIRRVWVDASGLPRCEAAFRGRRGVIAIVSDLRVICSGPNPKRPEVVVALSKLEKAGITVRDIRHPDATHAELIDMAFKAVANTRFHGNRRKARREGAKGGTRKGEAAQARRSAEVSDDIARRICAHPKLTWRERAAILGMPVATIERHYS